MKKALSAVVFSLLVLDAVHGVRAQAGNGSENLKSVAKSVITDSSARGNSESVKGISEKNPGPDSLEAHKYYKSGTLFYDSGKIDLAIEAFKQANKLNPDDPQIHYMLGMAHSRSKDYKEALESYKRAARLRADWPEAHFRLGVTYYVLGKKSQSIEAYNSLLKLGSPLAGVLRGIIKEENNPPSITENVDAGNQFSSMKPTEAVTLPDAVKQVPTPTVGEANPAFSTGGHSDTATASAALPGADSAPVAKILPSLSEDSSLTGIYRIGVGDVLDIRLLNSFTARSTLFTVIDGGLIDFPMAGGPIPVAGLTTDEVQARVAAELKRRAVEEGARVSVGVRQYASHSIIITGLVNNPGNKFLRREAVPLYVIIAEAQARLDAGRVTIMRPGSLGRSLDLSDPDALNFTIRPGDMISVTARPQEFYYIAGRINYPGQKVFQPGITLLQSILAAGGVVKKGDNEIELSREGAQGHLATTKLSLKEIKAGKIQDPKLQPGDRIEVH